MTAPAAPVLVARNTGASAVKLSWASVPTATAYKVYRGLAPNPTALHDTLGDVTMTFDPATPGTLYYYRIKASSAGGDSAYSNDVRVLCANTKAEGTITSALNHARR